MGLFDAFRYEGKRALVVGGATGMGAAVADVLLDAGAEVIVMDRAEVTLAGRQGHPRSTSPTRRRSTPPSTSAAARSHALFSCAGVADGTPGIERINFLGHRHLIDRLLAGGHAPPRLGHRLDLLGRRLRLGGEPRRGCSEYLDIADFDEATQWAQEQRQGRLHLEQDGDQRLRRPRGDRRS